MLYCEYVLRYLYFDSTQMACVHCIVSPKGSIHAIRKNTKDGNTAFVPSVWVLQESNDHSYGQ